MEIITQNGNEPDFNFPVMLHTGNDMTTTEGERLAITVRYWQQKGCTSDQAMACLSDLARQVTLRLVRVKRIKIKLAMLQAKLDFVRDDSLLSELEEAIKALDNTLYKELGNA